MATWRGAFPIGLLAQVAGVSRSGFYRWQHAHAAAHDRPLVEMLQREHARLRGIYGARRLQTLLRRDYGLQVNPQRIYRLCRDRGLQAVIRRRHPHGRFGTAVPAGAPNVLDRPCQAAAPHAKGVTDIPDLQGKGRPYSLSVLGDLFNQEGVAHQLSAHPDTRIVLATVEAAWRERGRPGLLLPSDQGVPDTPAAIRRSSGSTGGSRACPAAATVSTMRASRGSSATGRANSRGTDRIWMRPPWRSNGISPGGLTIRTGTKGA